MHGEFSKSAVFAAVLTLLAIRPVSAQAPQAGHPQGAAAAAPRVASHHPVQAPFQLNDKHQAYLDSILKYWEQSSLAVKRYRCKFQRWEYDCVFGPRDTYKTYSKGEIKYAAPDKGLFKVDEIWQAASQPGGQVTYVQGDDSQKEHWVCDGQSVYNHDYQKKQLIEHRLPPEMQGQAITDGPLPFLFGAKAEQIKERYWVQVITPRDTKGEYWLEAYPKRQEDAASFRKVHVIIDEEKFLPKALILFDCNYDERRNQSRTTFTFDEREVNWSLLPEKLNLFHREFYKPTTPLGWKKVVSDFGRPVASQPAASSQR